MATMAPCALVKSLLKLLGLLPAPPVDHLAEAVRKLGPKRAVRMLEACREQRSGSWRDCPLALAYGLPGVLAGRLADWRKERAIHEVARLLGLRVEEADAVVTAYDSGCYSGARHELVQLLEVVPFSHELVPPPELQGKLNPGAPSS